MTNNQKIISNLILAESEIYKSLSALYLKVQQDISNGINVLDSLTSFKKELESLNDKFDEIEEELYKHMQIELDIN